MVTKMAADPLVTGAARLRALQSGAGVPAHLGNRRWPFRNREAGAMKVLAFTEGRKRSNDRKNNNMSWYALRPPTVRCFVLSIGGSCSVGCQQSELYLAGYELLAREK